MKTSKAEARVTKKTGSWMLDVPEPGEGGNTAGAGAQ